MTAPRAYAIGYLEDVEVGPEIAEYIERIEATLAPYGGRFLVHGGQLVGHEGTWNGDIVILEFPGLAHAQEWYESPEYQAILPLRTEHSTSKVALVEGVPDGHRAADKIPQLFPYRDASAE
ncbi:DUF1330 domain-containing protein [Streptomyces sp. GMY02]|uniref:DUF1330 domain-containing protein n=1 Tax=Streptomyces sp. GMY02 TaxID=1333528 RepID=UPI001C2C89D9|nr:DUF1330 domain-containing protein [Streptomyces sp. GMY02]QXE36547.1 DUF1330 domain-containing protein [Streptomyces sp. GMY02]